MTDEAPWSDDRDSLAKGLPGEEGEKVKSLIDDAAARAKAGNLTAAAGALESARGILVGRNNFRRHDNDIWVFADILRRIRHQSPEPGVPPAYQRLLDAVPSAKMGEEMTKSQKAFWYGSQDAQVGGQIHLVDPRMTGGAGLKKGCFIATAVCGSSEAWEVNALRTFRDRTLLPSKIGRWAVGGYYAVSPALARWIEPRHALRCILRTLLIRPLARALSADADGHSREEP
jgi:hypothetical protein